MTGQFAGHYRHRLTIISIRLSLSVAECSIVCDMIFFSFNEPVDPADRYLIGYTDALVGTSG